MDIEDAIHDLYGRIPLFKKKGRVFIGRCIICGDSQKNKLKTRAYIYQRNNTWLYCCHNCQYNSTLKYFLKTNFPDIYSQYIFSLFKNSTKNDVKFIAVEEERTVDFPLLSIDKDINAKCGIDYLLKRKIPEEQFFRIYYTSDLRKLTCLDEEYLKNIKTSERHIVLPMFTKDKRLIAINARNIEPRAKNRYKLMRVMHDYETIFGLDVHTLNEHTYVLEGSFDSLFLPNSLAVNTSDLTRAFPFIDKNRTTFICDNQFRNKEVVGMMKKCAKSGVSMFVWPKKIKGKDVNAVILKKECSDIKSLIDENTFSGLRLQLELLKRIEI